MWVAALGDRLYRVDLDTLEAVPAAEPETEDFRVVQRIFHADRATYVVAGAMWKPVPERSGHGRSGVLWKLENRKWRQLIHGLDLWPAYNSTPFRPFLVADGDLWIGSYGSGARYLPAGRARPVAVDWHYGLPFSHSDGLFELADERVLLVSAGRQSLAVKPAELLAAFRSPEGFKTLHPKGPLLQDARGHLLGILSAGDEVLSDWDGKRWRRHRLPAGYDAAGFGAAAEDSLNRIWLLPDWYAHSVAIFDPSEEDFEVYSDYQKALEAQLTLREDFQLKGDLVVSPSFSSDGRICYRDAWARVQYFDGEKWRAWRRQEIDDSEMPWLDGSPFFDRAGHLAVNIDGTTWEYTQGRGWGKTEFERGRGSDEERAENAEPGVPPDCRIGNPESNVQDSLGIHWMAQNGQLYRGMPGRCRPEFGPEEHQPFIDSRVIGRVSVDLQGNAFLETCFHFGSPCAYVIIKARSPLPETNMQTTVDRWGAVGLHFSTHSRLGEMFRWRIDKGPWSRPSETTQVELGWLPNGRHRIEAVSIDDRLQVDPTPAVRKVEIRIDPRERVLFLIERLQDSDYSVRNAAVDALVRQSDLALPLLRSARDKANRDLRWWIDAAIQQMEGQAGSDHEK